MKKAKYIDELIQKHGTIMDRYDPEQRVGLIIDEWGTWFDPEPGTNPGLNTWYVGVKSIRSPSVKIIACRTFTVWAMLAICTRRQC